MGSIPAILEQSEFMIDPLCPRTIVLDAVPGIVCAFDEQSELSAATGVPLVDMGMLRNLV
jgi:hypothetical protein